MQKCKILSDKAEKRREAKDKGEKERYTYSNAEFQGEIRKPSSVINAKK